jgi:hypothetical protein
MFIALTESTAEGDIGGGIQKRDTAPEGLPLKLAAARVQKRPVGVSRGLISAMSVLVVVPFALELLLPCVCILAGDCGITVYLCPGTPHCLCGRKETSER